MTVRVKPTTLPADFVIDSMSAAELKAGETFGLLAVTHCIYRFFVLNHDEYRVMIGA